MKKLKIHLENSSVRVAYPPIEFFLDKIRNEEKFKFTKINHGMFDGIGAGHRDDLTRYENLLDSENYTEIAKIMLDNPNVHKQWGLKFWHKDVNGLLNPIADSVKLVHQYKNLSNDLYIGLSLGVGLGTFWGTMPHEHIVQVARRKLALIFDTKSLDSYYYSGIFKHYVIKNEIQILFDLLNQKGYYVAFFGPKYFDRFGEVFGIDNFTHIEIPVKGAIQNLDNEVERIREFNKTTENPTIVFLQCGQLMAANMVYRLLDDDLSIIDTGRSFDLLIKDELEHHDTMWKCWTGLNPEGLVNYVDNQRNN